jgi:YVTN family beta-propeller protein
VEFGILGPVLVQGQGPEVPLGGPRQRVLLVILLLHRGEAVSRDVLVEQLWSEHPPADAAHALDTYVSRLRKALGSERIERRPPGYRLTVHPGELDLDRFERLVQDAHEQAARDDHANAATSFREALSLWRGPALADVLYEPSMAPEAEQLEERRVTVLEDFIDVRLALGEAAQLVGELDELVRKHPFRERLVCQRALALYRAGRQTEALAALRSARVRLSRELGLDPGPQLRGLEAQILRHDPALAAPRPRRSVTRPRRRTRAIAVAALAVAGSAAIGIKLGISGTHATSPPAAVGRLVGLDADSGSVAADAPLPGSASAIAVDRGALWVVQPDEDSVARVDPRAGVVVQRIPVEGSPGALAAGAGSIWVASTIGRRIVRIDPTAERITQSTRLASTPAGLAFGEGALWIAQPDDRSLLRLDPSTGNVGHRVALAFRPSALAVGAGALWVASHDDATVTEIDPRSDRTLATIRVGQGPSALTVAGRSVWVANELDGTVSKIDARQDAVTATVATGSGPAALVIEAGRLFVANSFSSTVARIDTARDTVTDRLHVGGSPTALAGAAGVVWVASAPAVRHHGGTLVLLHSRPLSIDPAINFDIGPLQSDGLVRDGLVTQDHTGGPGGLGLVPDLAISLPTPTDGGTTYTFRLRPGIRYSDGTPLRASDFRRAIERLFRVGSPATSFLSGIVGASACNLRACDLAGGIVTDERSRTISVHLRRPDPVFLFKLTVGGFATPVPPGTPISNAGTRPIPGTGPYRIAHADSHGIRYARNPFFHEWSHAAQPDGNPDQIVYRFGLSPEQEVHAVERARADWTSDGIPRSLLREAEITYASRLRVAPGLETDFFQLNTRLPPFDDVRVRRAVNFAVDRAAVARLQGVRALAAPTCQVLPPGFPGYQRYCPYTRARDRSGRWKGPDVARARRLIAASHRRGVRVTVFGFNDDGTLPLSRYMAGLLRRLGFRARVHVGSHAELDRPGTRVFRTTQLWVVQWAADYPSPSDFLDIFFTCAGAFDHGWFCQPRLDRLVTAATRLESLRPEEARRRWARAERAYIDQAACVPLVNEGSTDLLSPRVGGYQHHPSLGFIADQAWLRPRP